MADTNKIGLEAIFDLLGFNKNADEYNRKIDQATSNTEGAGSAMSQVWTGLSTVGAAAWEGLAVGIAAVVTELGFAASAAADTEQVLARMNFIVANVGERSGVSANDVLALADSISKVVPIDDEVITSAITMGLTFDGVNKDNIQPLIKAAVDLATFTGKDLPQTMKELALAISDPDRAMRLLKDANITLTDAEMKTLKGFKDVGDTAGATTFILEELKKKGILGLGEVMGQTAKGKFTIMQTAIGNLQEALGTGLLEAFKNVFDRITAFANDPRVINFLTELGNKIGALADQVLSNLPDIFTAFQNLFTWLVNNKPIVIGVLVAIGAAMAVFAASAASAAITAAASFAPIIATLGIIAAVVAVFVKAWEEDWGGIREKVADAWAQVKPVFDKLQAWLKVNLPKALKALADFWTKTLLPAIKIVVGWIVDNVLPALVKLVLWLGDNVPKAIKETSDFFNNVLLPAIKTVGNWIQNTLIPILTEMRDWFQTYIVNGIKTLVAIIQGALTSALQTLTNLWQNVLLPALQAVYNFIQNNLMPIFIAVANLMGSVVGLAVKVLAGIWQNVLYPALQAVWNVIKNVVAAFEAVTASMSGPLQSAIKAIVDLWNKVFLPAIQAVLDKLQPFADFLKNVLQKAFDGIKGVIQSIVDWINKLADAINKLQLPDWMTPGSPTPWELGLRGVNAELSKLTRAALPAIRQQLEVTGKVQNVPGSSPRSAGNSISNTNQSTRNYVFGANFNIPNAGGFLESLQGL